MAWIPFSLGFVLWLDILTKGLITNVSHMIQKQVVNHYLSILDDKFSLFKSNEFNATNTSTQWGLNSQLSNNYAR